MLALREFPERKHLEQLQREFPALNFAHMEAYLSLLKTATDVVRKVDTYLLTHGLQQNRFTTLVVLYRSPEKPLLAFQLAESIGVKRPTMTGLLDGLEQMKLIQRQEDKSDRRGTLVRITEAGQRLLRQVLPGYYDLINESFQAVSEADSKAMQRILFKIQA